MPDKPTLIINAQDCLPGMKETFDKWYNEHAAALFKFKGLRSVARYKSVGEEENVPQYVAIYSFESEKDYEQYMASPEREAGMKVTGRPEGVTVKFRGRFELIKEWKR